MPQVHLLPWQHKDTSVSLSSKCVFVFVRVCELVQGQCVYACLDEPYLNSLLHRVTHGHFVVCCPEFVGVCLSDCCFAMTGLLSVFSLLPVQALKKKGDGQEEVEEEEDLGGPKVKMAGGGKLSLQDDGGSSDRETER